jgi:hypothetical protein
VQQIWTGKQTRQTKSTRSTSAKTEKFVNKSMNQCNKSEPNSVTNLNRQTKPPNEVNPSHRRQTEPPASTPPSHLKTPYGPLGLPFICVESLHYNLFECSKSNRAPIFFWYKEMLIPQMIHMDIGFFYMFNFQTSKIIRLKWINMFKSYKTK